MKFIKKNKITMLVIIIFIAVVYIGYFSLNNLFIKSDSPKYGDRLDGIEKVEIKKETLSKLEKNLKDNKNVKAVSTNISGRTLDIIITVDDKLSLKDAKTIGSSSYSDLTEEQIKFYAVQVFIKKTDEKQNNFPIIGYKQKNSKALVWTKDRAVTTTNESK